MDGYGAPSSYEVNRFGVYYKVIQLIKPEILPSHRRIFIMLIDLAIR